MKLQVLEAELVAGARAIEELPPPAFAEIAFAGRSNVGKSSLINTLAGRKRLVRTSHTPGATRGIYVYRLRVRAESGDARLDLVDLPGYGYAKRSKAERQSWGPLVEAFLRTRPGLRAVVVIVDARRGLEDDDRELMEFLASIHRHAVLVVTKLDKLKKSERKPAVERIGRQAGGRAIGFSAAEGAGRDELWRALLDVAHVSS